MAATKRSPAKATTTTTRAAPAAATAVAAGAAAGDTPLASASEQNQSDDNESDDNDNDDNEEEDSNGDNEHEEEEGVSDDNVSDGEDEEELDAVGFGDAMSKILGQSVAADVQPILAKRTTARMREIQAEKKGVKSARLSAAEKREKEQKDMVVPDHSTAVLDRRLRTIATKGVVALFNAIEKHQHQSGKKAEDEKSDKKVKEMSKDNFLGLLKASQKSVGEKAAPPKKSAWSVVQDDYMMGSAKLKDWDAAHGTEKGRVRDEGDAEAEAAEDAAWKQVGDLESDDDAGGASLSKRKSAKAAPRKPAAKKTKRS